MDEKKTSLVEKITLTSVPADQRKSWPSIAFIWAGSVICIPALLVGSLISAGMNFKQSALCMVIGYVLVVFYMCLMGIQSSDLGLPATVAISRAYGKRGSSFLVSLVIAVCMIGWFAAQTSLCASSFCNIMSVYFHVNFPLWLSVIIWGCLMFITSVYGVKLIEFLNKVSVPALFVMLIWGVISCLMKGAAATVSAYEPPAFLGWTYGITLAVAGFASGAICCGDYTRYCKSRKETILSSVVGVLPAGIGALLIGAFLSLAAGSYDLSVVFSSFGLPIVGMLVLILATWTTNTGNAYMSGLAACKMFSIKDSKRPLVTMICGVLGVIMAIAGLADFLNTYISILGAVVPPIMGVVICDYWVICKAKTENWSPVRGINWIGIIAWVIGGGFALLETLGVVTVFSSALDGVIIAFAAYWILYSLLKNTKLAGSGDMTIEEACSVAQ